MGEGRGQDTLIAKPSSEPRRDPAGLREEVPSAYMTHYFAGNIMEKKGGCGRSGVGLVKIKVRGRGPEIRRI